MMHRRGWRGVAIGLLLAIAAASAWAQSPAKRPITHDVYDTWK
jgi:hypothetical protein